MDRNTLDMERLKRAVLLKKLQQRQGERGTAPPRPSVQPTIEPMERGGRLPLSTMQQRLWMLDQLDPEAGAAYHMPAGLRLEGKLDRHALQWALDQLVARHESLRTTFVLQDGQPAQVIEPPAGFALDFHDLRVLPLDERTAALDRLSASAVNAPFDLGTGPLIRGQLLQLADLEHILIVTMHHIVSDGWSLGVMVDEFSALYDACSQGRPSPLAALPIQYADYALWQQARMQEDAHREDVAFWRGQLAGAPELLTLPSDRPRPALQSHAGATMSVSIAPGIVANLRRLAQQHGCTLFMTMLAGWATLMARMAGQDDVVIGTPVANRQQTQVEGLIGFFVNTLALRVRAQADLTVAGVLEQVKLSTLAAFNRQDVPFEQVVEALRPARSAGYSPLFQVMLAWDNTPASAPLALPDLSVSRFDLPRTSAHVDLSLSLNEVGAGIEGSIEYATALFDHASVARMAGYFQHLLDAMASNPQQSLASLPLLDDAGRRQMLVDLNDTRQDFPSDLLAHELFEAQAVRQPDAVALVHQGREIRYQQLNARANQVAHALLAHGIRPDDRVALCLERGVEMVVALLGILKAGAAYVPLDPAYPSDRLAYLLSDCAPAALITQAGLRARLPELSVPVLSLDAEQFLAQFLDYPESNPDRRALGLSTAHLAYLIYTSGSTGLPKGVMIEHGALLNYLHWALRTYRPVNGAVVSSSIAFDATITSLFTPLLCGASVTLLPEGEEIDGLEHCLRSPQGAGLVKITPAHLDALGRRIEAAGAACKADVFVIGGEALAPSTVQLWQRIAPGVRLVNEYGPTETVVGCASFEVDHGAPALLHTVPIGRPIANMRMYVLDAALQPVPPGVTGELYIGGVSVARGYWQRPQLTNERFIADSFSGHPCGRLYKTGDLGRWRADGNLEYLGRNDFQVKIRGFRIELGEIEAQLAACAGVQEAAVLAREDSPGRSPSVKRLVAYYMGPGAPAAADLRARLAAQLPDYMLPTAFVQLDTWPLTPNGKLDRAALPKPDGDAYLKGVFVAPEGKTETVIARIWEELLGIAQVGRNDHFFELGGHSLLAIQVTARLRQTLGCELAVRELFTAPELSAFAQVVRRAGKAALPPVTAAERQGPVPLSSMQQRLWLLDRLGTSGAAYHMPAGLRLQGQLDVPALQAALDSLLARHESLRTTFVLQNGQPSQVIRPADGGFALSIHDARGMPSAERDILMRRTLEAPFDLADGPLIRGQLVRLADDEHALLIVQHHIVSDGWSIGVMIDELNALYTAFSQGKPNPLPPLAIQYADYAIWQQRYLQDDARQEHIAFWRGHLAGAPALLALPTDRPRPPSQSHAGALFEFGLDAGLSARLHRLSQQHGCTMFMTLLAAWASLMARIAGQDDVVIGTPVANRQHAEVEGLIGFFVNTLALRVRLQPDLSVAGLLEQVKASTLAAYAHQDLPFEQVVDALQPARSAGHSPLFQVMLAWDNTPAKADVTLPGLSVSALPLPHTSSQFDLSLSLSEGSEGIVGSLEYACDLFDEVSVARLAASFRHLLGAMAEDADKAVAALPLLDEAARRQILIDFNDTRRDFPQGEPQCHLIHELFEARAARHPDAPAVCDEARELSFDELNRRANQVAHALLALGVQPDDRVALCLERGVEMIVAVLAILKAGAAYVPLDPGYPAERLAYLLEDSAPAALLTQASLLSRLPQRALPVIDLNSLPFDAYSEVNPDPQAMGLTSRHLAYLIYTSGSTGLPKGVMVEHASVLNLWRALEETVFHRYEEGLRVGLNASLSFDASVQCVVQLLSGHCLVIIPAAVRTDGQALLGFLRRQRVAAFDCTPAQLSLLLPAGLLADTGTGPERILIGGEAIGQDAWQALRAASHIDSYNVYGPTECCVNSTLAEVRRGGDRPHLGRPLANARAYVLDACLQPVPVGAAGELYIGGAGVARGYWNRPELTAERFILDPFADDGQSRLYRTGDLARWRADGTLDYLGRNDSQVKIRGFRIELGEIEARLVSCDGVDEAVVAVRADEDGGDKRLVAYYRGPEALAPAELRAALASALPEHMLPAAYVHIAAWPLTPNGKIDRNALPSPAADAYSSRRYSPPQGDIESAIADIWQALLGIETVGRHDHFFELGGHSLLVLGLIELLRDRGLHVEVRHVFSSPVLAQLAAVVERREGDAALPASANAIPAGCTAITPDMLALARLTQDEIDTIVARVPGGAANVQDIYPLSALQEGVLFHHLLDTQRDAYVLRSAIAFDSRERLDAFLSALETVIGRHDILRSAVQWDGLPRPVQVVHRDAPLAVLPFAPSEDGGDGVLSQLLNHTDPRRTRIDLQRAPLMRAHVAFDPQLGEWLMALVYHHLVCDHVTLDLTLAEIDAILRGDGAALPRALPYRDFIAAAAQVTPAEHEAYFRAQLGDVDAPSAPFGLLDVQGDGSQVEEASLAVDADLARRIRECARRQGVSPAVLFHVAWALVVAQCSGQDDVVFGTVLSGRLQGSTGADRIMGMFINTLPVRIPLAGRSALDVVTETHQRLSGLLVHEQASLALAQRCSAVPASLPLFTALFNYRHGAATTPEREGMRMLESEERTNYPIDVSVDDEGTGFACTAQCAGGVNPARLASYLHTAVEGLVDVLNAALDGAASSPVSSISILPCGERRQMLVDFNDSAADFPLDRTYAALFAQQAARNPGKIAAVCGDGSLTYAELEARTARLAQALLAAGAKRETVVALGGKRDLSLLAMMIAVLRTGAAFLTLDVKQPAERLRAVLRASGAPLLLVSQSSEDLIDEVLAGLDVPPRSLLAEALWQRDTGVAFSAPPGTPDDLAYIIFTSGSTGQPKGVMIEQRGMLNNMFGKVPVVGLSASDRVAQTASPAFDIYVWQFLAAPLVGATVHILADDVVQDPALLVSAIEQQRLSLLEVVPSMLRSLLDTAPASANLASLRWVLPTGEALPLKLAQDWFARFPAISLMNLYGPAECSDDVAFHPMTGRPENAIPIGRPTPNNQLYILDNDLRLVPIGVQGEICVAGAGVGRGYCNVDRSQAFVDHPFRPGARFYRTGDLGRYRSDGVIEYIGRNDFQVKIRGCRIELGEVEARLLACEGLADAVVTAREDKGEQRLVAYVVARPDSSVSPATLRAQLASSLPDFMVPSAFVILPAFPRTPNGKLDRRALPAPDASAMHTRAYQAPLGQVESTLAGLWQDLLGVERVGRHDNFFELGGHSLNAIQFVSRLRQSLGVELPLREIFAHPHLHDLAAAVAKLAQTGDAPITPIARGETLALSWAQQRLWFLDRLDHAAGSAYHIAAGLRMVGQLDQAALRAALARIVERHDILRTRFALQDGEPVQVIAPADGFPLRCHDLRALPVEEQQAALARLTQEAVDTPFDLGAGPLMRGCLLEFSSTEHVLLVTMHHIVSDGWSMGVMVKEFNVLYAAFSQGQPDPLPALPLQYADYALWQRRWLQGEVLQRQLDFWSGYLDGAPALLELPLDRPRPAMQDYAGASVGFSFDADLSAAIKALSRSHGTTLFMTLLSSWAILLARVSNQTDVVIGTPVANRRRAELETMIGFFVNTLALRVDLSGAPTVAQLLARVKESTLAAQSHQDIPFEQVVELLKPVRSLSHSPLFQVMFSWQNVPEHDIVLPGLRLEGIEAQYKRAKFDLSVSLQESGEIITGEIDYATALFDRATVERHLAQWRLVLEAMVADARQPVTRLALLTPAERQLTLMDWNANDFDFPNWLLLPQLFAEQAARTPHAVALIQGDTRLTYKQLNSQANRLAHHLIGLGVGCESRIAIGLRRSPEMLVALMAILKAGAAYVPLDPSYPAERLAYLLADSAPAALLTHSALRPVWGALPAGLARIELDADHAAWDACAESDPQITLRPDSLAYLIYTSGSTGNPKGVMIEHAALRNYLHWALLTYRPVKGSVVSSSIAFDATITSLFTPLLCGASVTLLEEGDEIGGLEACLRSAQGAGLVKITPAHLDVLGRRIEADGGPCTVDTFVIGGEALAPATVQLWRRIAPAARLINEYGPTETVVGCASHEVDAVGEAGDSGNAYSIPIGRPIANTRMYVLDGDRQPVPLGVTGELYIGGAGVARGYWQRDALSAERFIADPFSLDRAARLYKTGDLGRWRADGQLEYLGRNDSQVKIRGFRIELGEIEAHLAGCPGVQEAAVLAREDGPGRSSGDKRLVAYYHGADAAPAPALRAQLATQLPGYMVPAAFVKLDAWPLTPNGKLDRHALPAPGDGAFAGRAFMAPQGQTEETLARIWSDLLGLEQVGRDDHFFELGGHSLMIVTLVERLRLAGLSADVRAVFSSPTLAAMAAALVGSDTEAGSFVAPPNLIPNSLIPHSDSSGPAFEEFLI